MEEEKVKIFIMGKAYQVPKGLTIMKAMEHAGYQFIRGCGCRGGFCGACALSTACLMTTGSWWGLHARQL